jgi:CHAT domain-containing protein
VLSLASPDNDGAEHAGGPDDGFLRLSEVTFLRLNADAVVLSACETARGRRSRREGVSGLARAFLYAGSRSVVCSLWPVDDAATAELMAAFYRALAASRPAPEALQQARRALIHQGHAPFFWAPFVCIGD